jgi:hypothetical protein
MALFIWCRFANNEIDMNKKSKRPRAIKTSIALRTSTQAQLKALCRKLGMKQDELVARALGLLQNDLGDNVGKLIWLTVSDAIYAQLDDQAITAGYATVQEYIVAELLLALRGTFVMCPTCKRAVADERRITVTGEVGLTCQWCGTEFRHNIE